MWKLPCDISKKIKYEECKTPTDFRLNRPYSYECAKFCEAGRKLDEFDEEKNGGKLKRRKKSKKRRSIRK